MGQNRVSVPLSVTFWSVPISRVLFGVTWVSRVLVVRRQLLVRMMLVRFVLPVVPVACVVLGLQAIRVASLVLVVRWFSLLRVGVSTLFSLSTLFSRVKWCP